MANPNWSDVGSNISDMVQEAIDTEDFSKLSQAIQNTVSTAVGAAFTGAANGVAQGVNTAVNGVAQGMSSVGDSINRAADTMTGRKAFTAEKAQNPWKGNGKFERKTYQYMAAKDIPRNELYSAGGSTRAGGYLLTVLGAVGCFGFGIGMLIPWMVGEIVDADMRIALWVQLPFLVLSIVALVKGTSILGRIRRFKNYVRALGTRTCITIRELATDVGKSEGSVLKDVRNMIRRGMFRQGHIDMAGKSLFVTNQGYEAYMKDHQRLEEKKTAAIAEAREREAYKTNRELSEDVKNMIAEGQEYIDRIHKSNEAIQDEEVSGKLDGLETVVSRIFKYVEQHPESAPETKKLMKYYLPTTIKLLDSYQKLCAQPVQGPNISNSKKEIEDTLDTLNQAFARLFDNLYQDTSMDITSDISVLNTLLAQEGLTGKTM